MRDASRDAPSRNQSHCLKGALRAPLVFLGSVTGYGRGCGVVGCCDFTGHGEGGAAGRGEHGAGDDRIGGAARLVPGVGVQIATAGGRVGLSCMACCGCVIVGSAGTSALLHPAAGQGGTQPGPGRAAEGDLHMIPAMTPIVTPTRQAIS